jgi:glycosyltransferase involved in cell wall biosynthesis
LNALFSQTYECFEIIVVDDASTDNLGVVLHSINDPRLRVLHLTENVGVSAARNRGISVASGTYIAFCDADDICQSNRFEEQVAFLVENVEIGICGSAFTCFDDQVRDTIRNPHTDKDIRRELMCGNCFGQSTMMGRAEIFKQHPYNESLSVAEDYDLWARLSVLGIKFANLQESLLLYRWHPQQTSRHKGEMLDHVTRKIRCTYCVALLGDSQLLACIHAETVNLNNLDYAALKIADYCKLHLEFNIQNFRFLLAWMYQRLPNHGILQWRHWRRIQNQFGLKLDKNYQFNIFLLAFLPECVGQIYFATLIKLKR